MPKTERIVYFAVRAEDLDAIGVTGALEMLRYDGVVPVIRNGEFWILKSLHEPTVTRWTSYGIQIMGQVIAPEKTIQDLINVVNRRMVKVT